MSNSETRICEILEVLDKEFEIKVLNVNLFLGMEIHRDLGGNISLKSTKYINYILKKYNMLEANSIMIPADNNQNISICSNVMMRT